MFRRYEANISQNYYKWQVLNYRQLSTPKELERTIYSGDVIALRHAESGGRVCHDDQSVKREDQVYVRIYKAGDDSENLTTNNLFEVQQYYADEQETVQ